MKATNKGHASLRSLGESKSETGWRTAVADGQPLPQPDQTKTLCEAAVADTTASMVPQEACFKKLMYDSYQDIKKGIKGSQASGTLEIEIDPSKMMKCVVVLEELE